MEKLSVSKEFVLAAHKAACGEWKRKIESELPELFTPSFKEGQWVTYIGGSTWNEKHPTKVFRVKKCDSEYLHVFHDDYNNYQSQNSYPHLFRLATKEEIESHLIKLAEKKGFVKGVKFCTPKDKLKSTCEGSFSYNPDCDVLYGIGAAVYNSGLWATIIEEPKTYTFTRNQCGDITEISLTAISGQDALYKMELITGCDTHKYKLKSTN